MGAADGDGSLIVSHDLSQELCPGQAGNMLLMGGNVFRIIWMNGTGEDDAVNIIRYIVFSMAIEYGNTLHFQVSRQFTLCAVRAGYPETGICQDLGQSAHADAAYAHKVEG